MEKDLKPSNGVVVIGAANTDLIAYVSRLPKEGETIHGSSFQIGFGGKGANQAVACAKLSKGAPQPVPVAIITKLGNDSFGENTLRNFQEQGVETAAVYRTSEASSGVAPILVDEKGRNSIVIVTGANDLLSLEEVEQAADLIATSRVVCCQLEIPIPPSLQVLKVAKEKGEKTGGGVITVLNPAPIPQDVSKLPEELFQLSDIICPNETETEMLTGMSVKSIEEATAAAQSILCRGPKTVVLTLGERGCLVVDGPSKTARHIPAPQVDAVDTSGAGDCFVGTMLYYLALGKDVVEACEKAVQVASISVQRKGTQSSYPSREELSQLAWFNTSE
ncbi:Ribokinase [Balamuthia mandrillaris]